MAAFAGVKLAGGSVAEALVFACIGGLGSAWFAIRQLTRMQETERDMHASGRDVTGWRRADLVVWLVYGNVLLLAIVVTGGSPLVLAAFAVIGCVIWIVRR